MDLHYLIVAPVFLLMVTVLVAAHEYGHFLFAKLNGMDVEEFAIGLGTPRWIWMRRPQRKLAADSQARARPDNASEALPPSEKIEDAEEETVFTVRPLPVGGFVRIKGMIPQEDGSEILVPNGFYSKSPARRLAVLFAGPLFSVLAGMILLVGLFVFVGKPALVKPAISGVVKGTPAENAGLKAGDQIVALDGKPVSKWFEMTNYVRSRSGVPINFTIVNNGSTRQVTITPKASAEEQPEFLDSEGKPYGKSMRIGQIGARPAVEYVPMPIGEALRASIMAPVGMIAGVASIFTHPSQFSREMGGPLSMVAYTEEATRSGAYDVILLAGGLSISLGILNLLPIPPLDGGQMLVALAELFRRGRRLSIQVQNVVNSIGLALVGMLILSVLWIDLRRFIFHDASTEPQLSAPAKR